MLNINDIVERISFFRNQKGLSARELSFKIDKYDGYISKVECKEFEIPLKNLLLVIDALDISEEEFFARNYKTYKKDKELLMLIENLSDSQREHLLEFIQNR